jgi:hypothetical protein
MQKANQHVLLMSASSRPKYLLAWAISKKDYDDKYKIEQLKRYGLVILVLWE